MVEKYYRIYVLVHLPEGCLQGMGIFNNLFLKGKKKKGKNGKGINVYKCMSGRYKSDSPKGVSFGKGSGISSGRISGRIFRGNRGKKKAGKSAN